MRYAAWKPAAALLSPPTLSCSSPSSAPLLQPLRATPPQGGSVPIPRQRVSLPSSCVVRGHHFHDARRVLDETPQRTASAWTAAIAACARGGRNRDGMGAFAEMLAQGGGVAPNKFVLAAVLRCCAGLGDVEPGRRIHGWMLRNEVRMDGVLCNALLDMYAKCGDYVRTKRAFTAMAETDAVSWNIVIGACLQNGDILGSMRLFDESPMRDASSWNTIISGLMRNSCPAKALDRLYHMARAGVAFNHYTYSTALALAGMLSSLRLGRQLHGRVLTAATETDTFVRSSLMDMYCKCGAMESAALIFDRCSHLTGDVNFAWSTMVAGYIQNGREEEALEFFRLMLRQGVAVDRFTLTSAVAACANAGMVEQGRQVHGCVEKLGHSIDAPLASAIVDMYAKCGNLDDACRIFNRARTKNVALWTSMLCSYASHGKSRMAIQLFNTMTAEKITPNEVTLVGVLSACSHGRLVTEGDHFFKLMQEEYGIVPSIEHYNCMVDLYGRAGLLDKANNFIMENKIKHEPIVWKTLLSACRVHKDMEHAKLASGNLIQLEQCDAGSYVMMSNMYATHSKWLDTLKLRSSMREKRVWKQPGRSWIHLKNIVHTFVAGDIAHPRSTEIYAYLEKLMERLKELGYTSRTDLVAHDVEEEQRETALKFHSEKLAIAFGIISTPSGTPLRIFKNLRVCVDCHEAIKYISRATDREIVVRDLYRFHHFKDAKCSFEVKKQSSCSIHLVNKTDEYVAFKVKTTSPKRYCVRPNIGVILPRATCVFTVTMQAQKTAPPDLQIKDKFLVQTTAIPPGITDEGTIPAFFSKETRRYVEENKLRVVLVSATQPEAEQLISGMPNVKTAIEVPVAKETLNIVNEVPNVVNQVPYSLKASFPSLRESPAIFSEIPFPVNEAPTVQGDFPVPLKEAPATSVKSAIHLKGSPTVSVETQFSSIETNMTLKETPTVLRDVPVLLKEAPTTSAESAIRSKGSPTVSVESQFSSTEMNRTLKNTHVLRDFRVPLKEAPAAESAIHLKETQYSSTEMRSDIFVNTENLHSCHVEDVQNMKSELINLEGKLEEAENLIMKLREEARTTIQERDKLQHEMVRY
ncbi:hypothetical protein ACQ4PT_015627 [Festuca glaucescens]